MAVELITGHAGEPHISAADTAAINIATLGDNVVFYGDAPTLQFTNANTLVIGKFVLYAQGRFYRSESNTTVNIASGSQSGVRTDTISLRYTQDALGIEKASIEYFKGSSRAPYDYTSYDITAGARTVDYPLVQVVVNGLTPMASLLFELSKNIFSDTEGSLKSYFANKISEINNKLAVNVPYTEINTQYWYIHYWAKNGVCTVTVDSVKEGHTTSSWDNVTINPGRPLPQAMRPRSELWFPCIVDNAGGFGHTAMCIDTSGNIRIMNRGGNQGTALQALFATGTWAVS